MTVTSAVTTEPVTGLVLGADVGGSSIKIGVVHRASGEISGDTLQVPTPQPATPEAVVAAIKQAALGLGWSGPVGVAVPAVVKDGRTRSAANIDPSWIGADITSLCRTELHPDSVVINDADAAGVAEMLLGAGRGVAGTCLMLTLGTGIGSALFTQGVLVPNTEFGHLPMDGDSAEKQASASAKVRLELDYPAWAAVLQRYLVELLALTNPDVLVLGGGISKDADQWLHLLDLTADIRIAELRNDAGLVGAALAVPPSSGG